MPRPAEPGGGRAGSDPPAPAVTRFPPELQVKQFVAELDGAHGFRWRVFTTGSGAHYLFSCVQNPVICVPVLKSGLQPEIRSALANGWGHA